MSYQVQNPRHKTGTIVGTMVAVVLRTAPIRLFLPAAG